MTARFPIRALGLRHPAYRPPPTVACLPSLPNWTAQPSALRSPYSAVAGATAAEEASSGQTDGERALLAKLEKRFEGGKIAVQDISGGCGTFYAISVAHPEFSGKSTLKQHRLVNKALADDIKDMHGIQLKTVPL